MSTRSLRMMVAVVLVAGLTGSAWARIVEMRNLAASDPNIWHQYTFEYDGATSLPEADKATVDPRNLVKSAYGTGSTANIAYPMGFDNSTAALAPERIGRTSGGAGLRYTGPSFAWPTTITVEALIRPENLESGGHVGYAVAGPGSPTRGYYLTITENTSGDDAVSVIVGDNFTQSDNRRPVVSPFNPGDWYYVASTFTVAGGNTTINSYAANLSAGEKTLTQVLNNAVASGSCAGNGTMGIGMFTSGLEALAGQLDEVAIYNGTVSASTLQGHLDALWTETNVGRMRNVVSSAPGLIHHYTFEGVTKPEQLADKVTSGGVNLQELSYGTGSTGALGYSEGIDPSTTAFTSQRVSLHGGGAGLRSVSTTSMPSTLTVEALVCPENLETGGIVGYAVRTSGYPNRGYQIATIEKSGDDMLASIIGDSFTQADNRRPIVNPFVPGHWYYVANTYEIVGGNTVVNSYIADVSAGETTLTQVLNSATSSGTFGGDWLGIGAFATSAGVNEAFAGSLDEVAFYNRVLGGIELQGHLNALYVPEPTSMALLGLGFAALARRRRKHAA